MVSPGLHRSVGGLGRPKKTAMTTVPRGTGSCRLELGEGPTERLDLKARSLEPMRELRQAEEAVRPAHQTCPVGPAPRSAAFHRGTPPAADRAASSPASPIPRGHRRRRPGRSAYPHRGRAFVGSHHPGAAMKRRCRILSIRVLGSTRGSKNPNHRVRGSTATAVQRDRHRPAHRRRIHRPRRVRA